MVMVLVALQGEGSICCAIAEIRLDVLKFIRMYLSKAHASNLTQVQS